LAFQLTVEKCEILRRKISAERLSPYLVQTAGDLELALRLYAWNTSISESLYGIMQGFEVVLRNSSHSKLSVGFANERWWDVASLRDSERDDILDAESNLRRRGVTITAGRIVAELNLAFWTNLYSNFYEQQFWVKHLRTVFPSKIDRKRLHARFESIKLLRNRLAHHETLIRRSVQRDHAELLDAISWMSPNFKAWMGESDLFHERFAGRPVSMSQKED
jgi:hypothetical protein